MYNENKIFRSKRGYSIKTKNSEIIIDPYLLDSVNRVAGRPRTLPIPIRPEDINCDAVICTHIIIKSLVFS